MVRRVLAALALALVLVPRPLAAQEDEGVAGLISRLREVLQSGDPDQYLTLLDPSADVKAAKEFASFYVRSPVTNVVVRERERAQLTTGGFRVIADAFIESGARARIDTLQLDVKAPGSPQPGAAREWRIANQAPLTTVDGLYRLRLKPDRQFAVRGLTVTAEDLRLSIADGWAFAADTDEGVTALVIVGNGEMIFEPKPTAEKNQVRLFVGEDTLRAKFDTVLIRLNPNELDARLSSGGLVEQPVVNPRDLRKAESIFAEEITKSFGLDLSELSRDTWSLTPPFGDFLAEVRTKKFGTLTYARSGNEAEDITVFDRKRRKNLSVYSSDYRMKTRGRFYDEDAFADYDVEHYDIDVEFIPSREWIEGTTRIRLKVRAYTLATLTLRLAEGLTARSVRSDKHGRLFSVRVKDQNSLILNLPTPLSRDDDLTLTVAYGGRLPPLSPDREALLLQEQRGLEEGPTLTPELRFVYSNRSYWHPQAQVTDYATASLRLMVPGDFDCVATGQPAEGNPVRLGVTGTESARKLFVFTANQPVRYQSVAISRFTSGTSTELPIKSSRVPKSESLVASNGTPQREFATRPRGGSDTFYNALEISVIANPRQESRAEMFKTRVTDVVRFYSSLMGDAPYPNLMLALVDNPVPGGHSPAYFALLHQPLPTTPFIWRNDPVAFENFPEFFLAHEVAHQYWGQAVGWKNYHEQWLSEGFAQYFAALYAAERRPEAFPGLLRQMRRTALEHRQQGPIYLGYRLGHVRGDSRIFRSIIYNKGAMVLHMLRRLVGDETFFRALRRFYFEFRFRKAGTDDLQRIFEAETDRSLERFFERWVFEAGIPQVTFTYTVAPPSEAVTGPTACGTRSQATPLMAQLRFEQLGELVYDFPVTVSLRYENGEEEDVTVLVTDKVTERRVPLKQPVREIKAVESDSLVEIRQ